MRSHIHISAIRAASIRKRIDAQRRWIDEHGGNLYQYVLRYGSAGNPMHYGNGGEAIYAADFNELQRLQSELAKVQR